MKNTRPSNGKVKVQYSVAVGDPKHVVDLMLSAPGAKADTNVAVVDLAGFEVNKECSQDIVDYYFQLKRAVPKVTPAFGFVHEFADSRTKVGSFLKSRVEGNSTDEDESKAS